MKPIHGEKTPLWKELGLCEFPPIVCNFKIGDKVIYTNDYGVKFEMYIIGFSNDLLFQGRFIHLTRHKNKADGSAWWFAHKPSELCKE